MLTVNTIEFNGQKAVINSYSGMYLSAYGMKAVDAQREEWVARFPKASVQTEELSEAETMKLVAEGRAQAEGPMAHLYHHSWAVGEASKA